MRTRDLALACGTMLSVMIAGAAAQQEQPRPTEPTNPPTTDRATNADTFRALTKSRTTTTSPAQPLLLKDLEGVWRVEVSVNPEHWKMHKTGRGMDADREMDRNRIDDPNRIKDPSRIDDPTRKVDPTQPTDPDLNEPKRATDPADNTPPDPNNPNRIKDPFKRETDAGQPGVRAPGGKDMKSFVGYAETKLVLGDNILQQSMVLPDMMNEGSARMPQRIDGSPTTPSTTPSMNTGSDMFRGMTFIGFDADSQRYTIAFMDSRSGRIHCDSGTYDESGRRLVFHGKSDHKMDAGGTNRDAMGAMKGGENIQVVLEVLSPTQHRVTMYQDAAPGAALRPTPGANTPGQPAPADDANRRGLQPGQPADRNLAMNEGNVVYQATYTRASNEDSPRYQRLIREPGDTTMDRERDALRPSNEETTKPINPTNPAQTPRRDR